MSLRTAHGRNRAALVAVEVPPADEQRIPLRIEADPLAEGRASDGKVKTPAAARALAKMPRRSRYLPSKITADPKFAPYERSRREWLRRRRAELVELFGHVGHGVNAYLNSAAWLFAGAEFAACQAAETSNLDWLKTSKALSETARQHDLAAVHLSKIEAEARKSQIDPYEAVRQRIMARTDD